MDLGFRALGMGYPKPITLVPMRARLTLRIQQDFNPSSTLPMVPEYAHLQPLDAGLVNGAMGILSRPSAARVGATWSARVVVIE